MQHVADRVGLIREGSLALVATVDELRAHAATSVEVTFAERPPSAAFAEIPGVRELERRSRRVRFSFRGDADPLVKALARYHVSRSTATKPISRTSFSPSTAERKTAMLRNVYPKSLRDMRRSIVWWSLGLIAMTALMIAVYPTVRDNPDLNKLVENYPEA